MNLTRWYSTFFTASCRPKPEEGNKTLSIKWGKNKRIETNSQCNGRTLTIRNADKAGLIDYCTYKTALDLWEATEARYFSPDVESMCLPRATDEQYWRVNSRVRCFVIWDPSISWTDFADINGSIVCTATRLLVAVFFYLYMWSWGYINLTILCETRYWLLNIDALCRVYRKATSAR